MTGSRKRRLWWRALLLLGLLGPILAWLALGERGLIRLYQTEMERQAHLERIRRLTEENQALLEEVERLRNDRSYAESVARKELHLVKPGELVYRIQRSRPDPNGPQPSPPGLPLPSRGRLAD